MTSFCRTANGLVVGTMHSGLFRIVGDAIAPLSGPTNRVTQLGQWHGSLVVGGMDGAWMQTGKSWAKLSTGGEETTSISTLGDRLAVTTAAGIYFNPSPISYRN